MFYSLFYEPEDFYLKCTELMESQNGGVAVARGWPVQRIDVENRKVFLEDDYEIQYDKCLIATGKFLLLKHSMKFLSPWY